MGNCYQTNRSCEVCGKTERGFDLTLEDAKMIRCLHGHTFCEKHLKESDKVRYINLIGVEGDRDFSKVIDKYNDRYNFDTDFCPLCKEKR